METITYMLQSQGQVLVRRIPWSIRNQTVASMESVDGRLLYSFGQPPVEPAELIELLKAQLAATDYQAIKFAEGQLSADEYVPMKTQRAQWRAEINELERGSV